MRNPKKYWALSCLLSLFSPLQTAHIHLVLLSRPLQLALSATMYYNGSTPAALANLTLTQPAKLSYLAASSADSSESCSCTALTVSMALLSGILGGAVLFMAGLLLVRKSWMSKKSVQNDNKELKSKYEEVPQSGSQQPCGRLVYCRGCMLYQQ
jgi:hypothetical protein